MVRICGRSISVKNTLKLVDRIRVKFMKFLFTIITAVDLFKCLFMSMEFNE